MKRVLLRVLAACLASFATTAGADDTKPSGGGLVVVAPHPDDEALTASALVLAATARGEAVDVVILTNGDWDCRHDARRRQAESVAGLRAVGVSEEHVFFLGYPDGSLAQLGERPLPSVPRLIGGRCELGNTTYGRRGWRRRDFHAARTGRPGPYTADGLVSDLRALLGELRPRTLVVTHPEDTHSDHAAAYAFVRRALRTLPDAPRILRALVHNGDCWPTGPAPGPVCPPGRTAPSEPTPPPRGTLAGYEPDERRLVPESCRSSVFELNPKLRAIAAHSSQTQDNFQSYLFAFARRDEAFYGERLVRRSDGRWAPLPSVAEPHAVPHFQSLRPKERRRISQQLPGLWAWVVPRPRTGRPVRVALLESEHGRYVLAFDGATGHVDLLKERPGLEPDLLQRWALPHDSFRGLERFELEIARRPNIDGPAELSLFRAGELVGVAVDVHPLGSGESVANEDSLLAHEALGFAFLGPSRFTRER